MSSDRREKERLSLEAVLEQLHHDVPQIAGNVA